MGTFFEHIKEKNGKERTNKDTSKESLSQITLELIDRENRDRKNIYADATNDINSTGIGIYKERNI